MNYPFKRVPTVTPGRSEQHRTISELMCTKQSNHETPQQFLYRVMGLKQKILFAARQADSDRKYSAATVQDVFLHTVYQGLSHRCKDNRSELKLLLADSNVTDDAILRHVMKVTSDENERLRRLDPPTRTKPSTASSAQVHSEPGSDEGGRTEAAAKKSQNDLIKKLTRESTPYPTWWMHYNTPWRHRWREVANA